MTDRAFNWCSIDTIYSNRYAQCAQQCPQLARILVQTDSGQSHTSCQPSSPSAISLQPNITQINTILSLHNNARSIVVPTAANMPRIVWDSRLARVAQSRANQCIFAHDCGNCRRLLNNATIYVGQNAYAQGGGSFDWSSPVQAWLGEKKFFAYGSSSGSSTGNWADVGHYTQIINDGTYAVGCGASQCGSSFYAYCNYAFGQYGTSKPYASGTPCTNCNSNLCSNNLCNCNKICQNGGTLDTSTCTCKCLPYAVGDLCEQLTCSQSDQAYGCWGPGDKTYCQYSNTVNDCPFTCGVCSKTLV